VTAVLAGCSVAFGLEPAATARPYALAATWAAMALWAALRADGRLLFVAHLLGLFTHPVFAFVSAASAIAGLGRSSRRWLVGAPAAALAVYLVTWWPMLRRTADLPARTWMAPPGFGDVVRGTLFWGDHGTPVMAAVLIAAIGVRWFRDQKSRSDPGAGAIAYAATTAALVMGSTVIVSQMTPVYLAARTPVFVLPAVSLAAGVAIAGMTPAIIAMGIAAMLAFSAGRYTVRTSSRPDPFPTRESLAAMAARTTCGDVIVAAGLSYAPVRYYAARAGVPGCVAVVPFPEGVRDHPGWLEVSDAANAAVQVRAAAEAARLPKTGTLWVLVARDGIGRTECDALVRELSARRRTLETAQLKGSFFDELRVFRP
jgi:hypothetical protein